MVLTTIIKTDDQIGFPRELLSFLSTERRAKADRFIRVQDRKLSLLAELFVSLQGYRRLGIPLGQLCFYTNEYGRPYIEGDKGFLFNISHSGRYVAVAISKRRVGVDIERIQKPHMDIARRFYAKAEYDYLQTLETREERAMAFYKLWTLKESFVKAEGKGLAIPLHSFSFNLGHSNERTTMLSGDSGKGYRFQTIYVNDYCLSLCHMETAYRFRFVNEQSIYTACHRIAS